MQVAFDQGVVSSTPIRTYGVHKDEQNGSSTNTQLRSPISGKGVSGSPPLTAKETAAVTCSDITHGFPPKMKEYIEPWVKSKPSLCDFCLMPMQATASTNIDCDSFLCRDRIMNIHTIRLPFL